MYNWFHFLFSKVTLPLNKFQGFKRKNTTERKTVSNQPESPNNLTKHTLLRSSSAKAACLVTWLPGQNTSGEIHIAATCDHLPSAAFSSFRMVNIMIREVQIFSTTCFTQKVLDMFIQFYCNNFNITLVVACNKLA